MEGEARASGSRSMIPRDTTNIESKSKYDRFKPYYLEKL